MNSPVAQFAISGRMGLYEASHNHWGQSFKPESSLTSMILEPDQKVEDSLHGTPETSKSSDQETNKPNDKVLRRLAQNREAARKSRLRKKAYVQQLESSRLKLTQLEQELERARQPGVHFSGSCGDSNHGIPGASTNTGIAMFEMNYNNWVEGQNRQTRELRAACQAHVTDLELRMLVETGLAHYDDLFSMKALAAKSDVFYLLSGMWRTSAERFFLWIGGFRPSELLKILRPQLYPLAENQVLAICSLEQSSLQAEDALSQGMEKLQETLAEALVSTSVGSPNVADYMGQMASAMDKLEGLANFVLQADNLRQQTLQRMYRILTVRQSARGLLVLGDYFQRLRALSSLWTARPREPA
ncbi:transcription factor HBP-1b(c38)-like isoform X1 [Nymphaea colorata]|nr:transcription factor HBP-1b(c38)-like isoform X1 [Nymphaea colorata]XP_031492293.1 transcription factor HBP-1b(c38)-like isoform X1 [Nymphaea colorata]XP_031492294.1 transcription factor HBP-1b(c38)-like isoform X1 [Nymphaea colorata]